MTVVSSKDFIADEDKYFDLALNGGVCIRRGDYVFHLVCQNVNDLDVYHPASVYEEVLEPDDDFRRAISIDELHKRVKDNVHKWYSERDI